MWWTLGTSKVRRIHCDDIDGDGAPEILVGAGNMRLNVLNCRGESLWRFRSDHGIPTTIITADIFGEGRRRIVYGNGLLSSNGNCRVLSQGGRVLKTLYNDSWCTTLTAIAAGDLDGDGKKTLFCGNNRGNLRAYDPNGDERKPKWIRNLAGTVHQIVLVSRTPSNPGLVVAASDSACLTSFAENGKKEWYLPLTSAVLAATVLPGNTIAAGCKDGTIFLVSPTGRPLGKLRTRHQLRAVLSCADDQLIVITKRRLLALSIR